MKRIVVLTLGTLLLTSGLVSAAGAKTAVDVEASKTAPAQQQKFDLNQVTHEQLVGIPGIGPHMARAILALREKKGAFTNVEELLEVSGIKEKKLASLSGFLEVVPPPTSSSRLSPGNSR